MTEIPAEQLNQLLAENACRCLVERYTYCIDWMNWNELEELFWPEAHFDFGMWSGDRCEYLPWVAALEAGYDRRLHMFSMPRLQIDQSRGQGEVGATMYFRLKNESGLAQDELMFGRYLLEFECRAGSWRMSALTFLMHGIQRFEPTDTGGAPFFADNLSPLHPLFKR